ncbi:MAG TPA: hypothetical protein VMY99_00615 [Nevskiaceae bacterium]|nr:hypothetical protein [Nevskiaceae bacterium]
MARYYISQFAANYGEGAYNSCTYDEGCPTATGSTADNGGSLTNTGVAIAGIVTLACLIIFVALVVRWWRRPSKVVTETVEADEEPGDDSTPPAQQM